MKIKIATIIFTVLVIASCQQPADVDAKKKALKDYKEQLKEIQDSISSLEKQIASLSTEEIQYKYQYVNVVEAKKDSFNHYVEIHGEVEASNNILVHPEVQGNITGIFVSEGQKVTKGQTIATIDASVMENNLAELETQLDFATTMFEKQKRLYDQNIGSEVQYLQAKNQKESLENSIQTLRSQRGKFVVKSPISGVIDEIFPNNGEIASPGMPVARVVNLDKVSVEADVSENYLGKVDLGDEVDVIFKSIDVEMKGTIVQIGQFISENNRTFKIKIDLKGDNDLIKPNLLSVVRFKDYSNPASISVPSKVVLEDLKGKYVFVSREEEMDGGTFPVAKKQYVELGQYSEGMVELRNIEEGELIITAGYNDLAEGEKLNVNNSDKDE